MQQILQQTFEKNPAIAIIIFLNLTCFCLMIYDKGAAKARQFRVSKKLLFISAVCFGAIGGCCAMWLFNHKNRKTSFKIGFPVLAIVQSFLIYLAFTTNWGQLI